MQLTQSEERMISLYRHLPRDAADRIATIIERLANENPSARIDWSDDWSEQDKEDFTRAAFDRYEEKENNA